MNPEGVDRYCCEGSNGTIILECRSTTYHSWLISGPHYAMIISRQDLDVAFLVVAIVGEHASASAGGPSNPSADANRGE